MKSVTIIGLGLIGGSLGLSLKDKGLCDCIMGIEHSEKSARRALELGLVDYITTLDEAIDKSDLIVLATPVDTIPTLAVKILNRLRPDQILMDMGSTKQELCELTAMHPNRGRLVATHPMWGTEFSGPEAATADSFAGRNVVICQKELSDAEAVATVEQIYRKLGMGILEMDAEQHDLHAAYVSHISHITSFILSTTVLEKEREEEAIFNLAGGGFDSTARLAKSSADTWIPIFKQNKYNVLDVLREYIHQLNLFRKALERDDYKELEQIISRANHINRVFQK